MAEVAEKTCLSQVRNEIKTGDLLLFRGKGLVSQLIRSAGRSEYSHAARAVWWGEGIHKILFCCEVRERKGGRAVTLESQVRRYPGCIDVYRVNPGNLYPEYCADSAMKYMRKLAGCDYGYWSVMYAWSLHVAPIRWFVKPSYDDLETSNRPPYCSQACAAADRIGGGVDPVPNLSDRLTEPGDLARSGLYRYFCTLTAV